MKKLLIFFFIDIAIFYIYTLNSAIRSGFSYNDLRYLSSIVILMIAFSYKLYKVTRPDYRANDKEFRLTLFALLAGLLLGYVLIGVTLILM